PAQPPTTISTLSLHDALPICALDRLRQVDEREHRPVEVREVRPQALALRVGEALDRVLHGRPIVAGGAVGSATTAPTGAGRLGRDRKSTRLNSSHLVISYAVF